MLLLPYAVVTQTNRDRVGRDHPPQMDSREAGTAEPGALPSGNEDLGDQLWLRQALQ